MKTFIRLSTLILIFFAFTALHAQKSSDFSPLNDYNEKELNNTDTIPDYESKLNKLKLTGIIYRSDGVTPANDVILYIEQADEHGDFDLRKENDKRYVHNRGWIKTDADGRYTFYTFVPGNDRRYNRLQEILPTIKESASEAYNIGTFLFDNDPLLTKRCRKIIARKDDATRIMTLKERDGLLIAEKDIILPRSKPSTKVVSR